MKNAGRPGRLLMLATTMLALSGCKLFHHRNAETCNEPPFTQNQGNLPPLKIPAGLDAPDTRNAVHIPALNEPERPRTKNEPCLSQPPSYVVPGASVEPPFRTVPNPPNGGVAVPPSATSH